VREGYVGKCRKREEGGTDGGVKSIYGQTTCAHKKMQCTQNGVCTITLVHFNL